MSEGSLKELPINERTDTDILIVHEADGLQEYYSQIKENPDRFVVVLDEDGVPVRVTTAKKLDGLKRFAWDNIGKVTKRLAEVLEADENVTLERAMVFYQTMQGMDPRPPGLVVIRDNQVAGILSYDVLVEYFNQVTVPEREAQGIPIKRAIGMPNTIADAVFRCRRHPRCSFEITASSVDAPPLCGEHAAHGRTRLQA